MRDLLLVLGGGVHEVVELELECLKRRGETLRRPCVPAATLRRPCVVPGSVACFRGKSMLIRKHDHFTPAREIRRHGGQLARNHPEGL